MRRFCCEGRHLDAVERLLGPNVALTHNQFIVKLPGTAGGESNIPLHQDNGYGRLEPPDDVTVFAALTDMTTENGCLHIAPRSHLGGLVEHQVSARNPALREAGTVDTVPLELAAGEAVAFSGYMLHGSGANRTDAERVALFAALLRSPRADDDPRRKAGPRRRPFVDGSRRSLARHLAARQRGVHGVIASGHHFGQRNELDP